MMTHFIFSGCVALGTIKLLNRAAAYLPSPLERMIRWVHALAFEALAFIFDLFVRPFAYLPEKPLSPGKGKPILLVHGYSHNRSAWFWFKRRLAQKNIGPIYTINLGNPLASIEEHASSVAKMAQKIEEETGKTELILIGHSMGGLVNECYAKRMAPPGKVTDLVAIGAPLGGTYTAYLGVGKSAKQMKTGSAFIRQMRDPSLYPDIPRIFHIATKTDLLIVPYTSALQGRKEETHLLIEDLGHLSLIYSSRVVDKIASWLS